MADALALACSVVMMAYGWRAALASYKAGSMAIKALITPEWWALAPLPLAFALLAIEVLFRSRDGKIIFKLRHNPLLQPTR